MEKDKKSQKNWKKKLPPEAYHVLREKGTERPFQNKYFDSKKKGTYVCAGCGQPLFESKNNMIPVQDGPVFMNRLIKDVLKLKRI